MTDKLPQPPFGINLCGWPKSLIWPPKKDKEQFILDCYTLAQAMFVRPALVRELLKEEIVTKNPRGRQHQEKRKKYICWLFENIGKRSPQTKCPFCQVRLAEKVLLPTAGSRWVQLPRKEPLPFCRECFSTIGLRKPQTRLLDLNLLELGSLVEEEQNEEVIEWFRRLLMGIYGIDRVCSSAQRDGVPCAQHAFMFFSGEEYGGDSKESCLILT